MNDEFEDRPRRRNFDRRDDEYDDIPRRDRAFDNDPPPKKSKTGMIIGIVVGVLVLCCGGGGGLLVLLAYKGGQQVMNTAGYVQYQTNVKQVGLAYHEFHDRNDYVALNSVSKDGKPLLSWRVHLLPYLEQESLYNKFKLDEPWDSPNNIKLLNQIPDVYVRFEEKSDPSKRNGKTHIRGFTGPGTWFEKSMVYDPTIKVVPGGSPHRSSFNFTAVPDGVTSSILFYESAVAVEWTKPDDVLIAPGQADPALTGVHPKADTVIFMTADGVVKLVPKNYPFANLKPGILINDSKPAIWP